MSPKAITSRALPVFVLIVTGISLACYVVGKPEWTAWIGDTHMAFVTALCLAALAFDMMIRDKK